MLETAIFNYLKQYYNYRSFVYYRGFIIEYSCLECPERNLPIRITPSNFLIACLSLELKIGESKVRQEFVGD